MGGCSDISAVLMGPDPPRSPMICHVRKRSGRRTAEQPGWMKAIDTFTPVKSVGLAAALAVANPKSLVLVVGGAVSIASSTASTAGGKTVAAALMVLIASLCTVLPLVTRGGPGYPKSPGISSATAPVVVPGVSRASCRSGCGW
ncbi:GAP family protein [Streptomyces sp. NPDC051362]|uniref:GAP family protein n=1 Tax=Streptomyces sp. NPDC051362 TaxID=3365651 RepID=UPI0037B72276